MRWAFYAFFSLFFFTGSVAWGCDLMGGYHDTFFLLAGLGWDEKRREKRSSGCCCGVVEIGRSHMETSSYTCSSNIQIREDLGEVMRGA